MSYKDYLQGLRKLELEEAHIDLCNVTPEISSVVQKLENLEHKGGLIQAYYGDTKNIITAFIALWEDLIHETIIIAEEIAGSVTKDEYLDIIDQSINVQKTKQVEFGKEYLPITLGEEMAIYEDIKVKYDDYMRKMSDKKKEVELIPDMTRKFSNLDIITDDKNMLLQTTHKTFIFTCNYIALMLMDRIKLIKSSLEEIINDVKKNIQTSQLEFQETDREITVELYECTKKLFSLEKLQKSDVEHDEMVLDEVRYRDDVIRNRQNENSKSYKRQMQQLNEDLEHWMEKSKEVNQIHETYIRLKDELKVMEQEKDDARCTNLPGSDGESNCSPGVTTATMENEKARIHNDIEKVTNSIITHFAFKGFSTNSYRGKNKLSQKNRIYLLDKFGRYYIGDDGEKVYNRAVASSSHRIDENRLFHKIGEQEKILTAREEEVDSIIPQSVKLDIKETLDADTTQYIWSSLGSILPDALADVGKGRPRNPVHYLAHSLLKYNYGRSNKEAKMKQLESEQYRSDTRKARIDKIKAEKKLWASKMWKRSQIEDDTEFWQKIKYSPVHKIDDFLD